MTISLLKVNNSSFKPQVLPLQQMGIALRTKLKSLYSLTFFHIINFDLKIKHYF